MRHLRGYSKRAAVYNALEDVKNRLEEIETSIETRDWEDAADTCQSLIDEVSTLREKLRAAEEAGA